MNMSTPRTYVVSYDIADDARRERMARLLESRGTRVQRSVFEVLATPETIAELTREATAAERFDPAKDTLRCYQLCATCLAATDVRGTALSPIASGRPIVL